MNIAILGATGNIGRPLMEQLAAAGHAVRAATRSADKPLPAGVTRVSAANFGEVMRGAEKVFMLVSPAAGPNAETEAIAAAKAAGVKHVVKLSSIGASGERPRGLGVHHLAKENELRASGLAWTMLRPGFFMSNALAWLPQILEKGEARNPYGEGLMYPIAPEDIAAVAALALTTSGHEGKLHELTGEVAITGPEEIATMARVLGKTARVVDVPPEVAAEDARARGASESIAAQLKELYVNVRANRVATHTSTARELLGRPLMTFEAWCRARLPKP